MAEVKFSITDLFGRVKWGGLPFPGAITGNIKDYSLITKAKRNQEVFSPNSPEQGKPVFAELKLGDVEFAIPPVVTLSGQINVVSTAVAGQDGTVKEVISVEDYRINLKCFLTDNEVVDLGKTKDNFKIFIRKDSFPEQRVREIKNLFEEKKSVKVVSPFLNLFNIQYLLITAISFPELEGITSVVPAELECISDRPVQLNLNEI